MQTMAGLGRRLTAVVIAVVVLRSAASHAGSSRGRVELRRPSARTLQRADQSVRDLLRVMGLAQRNQAAIRGIVQKAGHDVGIATSLIEVKRIAAPVILREDGTRVGWRGKKSRQGMWSAGEGLTLELINKVSGELPTRADRRFALTMAAKVYRGRHPASMGGVAEMIGRLPAALERAKRDPSVKKALDDLYQLADSIPGPPSTEGWAVVRAIGLIAAWPAERAVPREVLTIADRIAQRRTMTHGPMGDTVLSTLEYAIGESLGGRDPRSHKVSSIEHAWHEWRPELVHAGVIPE